MSYETLSPSGRPSRMDHARRIRDLLRTRILHHEFGDGRLPDESMLMAEYAVGRNVVRGALSLLQQEGFVCRTQGLGTFSMARKTSLALRGANGFAASVESAATRIVSRVLSSAEFEAPHDLAAYLDVEPGTRCLTIDLTTALDGVSAVVLTSYVVDPDARAALRRLIAAGSWQGDWYDLLSFAGLRPVRRRITTEAVGADADVAGILGIANGTPVLRCERSLRLGDGDVAEFGYSYNRGDMVAFTMADGVLTAGGVS